VRKLLIFVARYLVVVWVFVMHFPVSGANQLVPVKVKTLQMETIVDEISALGTTLANESILVTVDTSEKISQVHFEEGQHVEVGDILVSLNQQQEQAQLRSAKALLEEAQKAYDRANRLSMKKAISAATVQERRAALSREQSAVSVLEARLAELTISAPFSGVLGLRQVSVGALVKPGDVITTLDDLSKIKLDFAVPSRYLKTLEPGLSVEAKTLAFGDQVFKGQVIGVAPRVDPVTRTVLVRAIFANESGLLKPGLMMSVELFFNQRQRVMLPEEAVFKQGEKSAVYVAELDNDPKAVEREVQLGRRIKGEIEVLEGLSQGEQVVTHGVHRLRSGVGIVVQQETAPQTQASVED